MKLKWEKDRRNVKSAYPDLSMRQSDLDLHYTVQPHYSTIFGVEADSVISETVL